MRILLLTYLFVLVSGMGTISQAQAGVDTTRADTVVTASQQETVEFKVVPWNFRSSMNNRVSVNDSTLRWQIWPGWTYKKNRDPGVISYRLGTALRSNALLLGAHEPRYQELSWEGKTLNDPVSGMASWHLVPLHKVSKIVEDGGGIRHETNFFLKEYYLNKPLTRLGYEESKFNYQNLNFLISQNFSQKINAELGYMDRRAGGEYNNSEVEGRQVFGRIYYLPDHRQALKLQFLNNYYDVQQPFGYVNTGGFDRFVATANEPLGKSDMSATTLALNYYRRNADSAARENNFHAALYSNSRNKNTSYSADTIGYTVRAFGSTARKWWDGPGVTLEGAGTAEMYINSSAPGGNLEIDHWSLLKAEGNVELDPLPYVQLAGEAQYRYRGDGYSSYSIRAESKITAGEDLLLSATASTGTQMPTPQQLYWKSVEYRGDPALENERIMSAAGRMEFNLFDMLDLGVKGGIKNIEDAVFMGADSLFKQGGNYNLYFAAAYFNFDHPHLELSGSATVHKYDNQVIDPAARGPLPERERIWLKGSAYWKGYLFERAAFVKAGVSGMFSPGQYRAGRYDPVLDYWQPGFEEPVIASFNRLDVDISARVRTIMLVMRLENVLDDVAQLGYFETAGYPMSQRRFIFGIRALFRN